MDIFYICAMVPSVISLAVGLVCFALYWKKFFQHVDSGFQLLASQCLDFGLCLATIFYIPNDDVACKAQGYFLNIFYIASVLWSSFTIFQVYYEYRFARVRRFKAKSALLFTILSSIVLAFIPFSTDSYGKNLGFCYMKTTGVYKYMVLIYFHLPFWIFSILTFVLLRKIELIIKDRLNDLETQMYFINTLRYFPISLIISYIPLSITRLIEIFDGDINNAKWFVCFSFAISRLHTISTSFFLSYSYIKEKEYHKDGTRSLSEISDVCRSILNERTNSASHTDG